MALGLAKAGGKRDAPRACDTQNGLLAVLEEKYK
jgi:hypothetical protein